MIDSSQFDQKQCMPFSYEILLCLCLAMVYSSFLRNARLITFWCASRISFWYSKSRSLVPCQSQWCTFRCISYLAVKPTMKNLLLNLVRGFIISLETFFNFSVAFFLALYLICIYKFTSDVPCHVLSLKFESDTWHASKAKNIWPFFSSRFLKLIVELVLNIFFTFFK